MGRKGRRTKRCQKLVLELGEKYLNAEVIVIKSYPKEARFTLICHVHRIILVDGTFQMQNAEITFTKKSNRAYRVKFDDNEFFFEIFWS